MKKFIATILAFSPVIALAQGSPTPITNVESLAARLTSLGNLFIQILIAFAVIWIIFNVVRYLIMSNDDGEKRKIAGKSILWGVVGLFVILSIWGLVRVLTNSFNLGQDRNRGPGLNELPLIPSPRP